MRGHKHESPHKGTLGWEELMHEPKLGVQAGGQMKLEGGERTHGQRASYVQRYGVVKQSAVVGELQIV